MNRHNLPLAWHAATDMSAIGWVMIAYSSNSLISQEWLASIAEGDSIINATLLCKIFIHSILLFVRFHNHICYNDLYLFSNSMKDTVVKCSRGWNVRPLQHRCEIHNVCCSSLLSKQYVDSIVDVVLLVCDIFLVFNVMLILHLADCELFSLSF